MESTWFRVARDNAQELILTGKYSTLLVDNIFTIENFNFQGQGSLKSLRNPQKVSYDIS
jgi:hypothetical protein